METGQREASEATSELYTTLTLSCHCHSITVLAHVPTSSLPLPLILCHCTTCRLVSGQLCDTACVLPASARPLSVSGTVKPAAYSTGTLTRCFCATCGTRLFEHESNGKVAIDTGALKSVTGEQGELLVRVAEHIFVGDTLDGGLRDFMPHLPAWEGWQGESKVVEQGVLYRPRRAPSAPSADEELQCGCHCGGVEFSISRPDAASRRAVVRERLDLIVPHYADAGERANVGNEAFWVRGLEGDKYLAGLCVCDDCRTAAGCEVQAWSWIPIANVHGKGGKGSTLRRYKGSERAWREFCGRCGAAAFFGMEETEGKRELVDVSVGLMGKGRRGARVEEWLDWWTERVSYEDLADNRPFAEVLGRGVREWGESRKEAT